eukprot:CAMPEP_0197711204 /NCGR_PEP_ID=MMETSP1338-20131121/129339_1 /TAXON_ID=43686 ORGANISM="Pelagodinium beii, Strain RCC1491" /NCGR_SAMPLE_ID=MMETSP1338 /ASSEMBLY_ACC=CAM_ASM_000754 /LENGTH=266 /DNA_ID=CAMNT_0043295137 /DNA_START=7 /DNA_END=804 /DNA_ORIENTATION=+
MPKDCFMSVRLGDVQKISRLGPSRLFRFPPAVTTRKGKIEVFQRIGAYNLDVDSMRHAKNEVAVDCAACGFGWLGLRVGLETPAKLPAAHEEKTVHHAKIAHKVQAAKEYLDSHGLEATLSQAMQSVLSERPENPLQFLAAKLLGEVQQPEPAAQSTEAKAKPDVQAAPPKEAAAKTTKVELARAALADEMLKASEDGSLAKALSESAAGKQKSKEAQIVDQTRLKAHKTLATAALDGSLEKAITELKVPKAKEDKLALLRAQAAQ